MWGARLYFFFQAEDGIQDLVRSRGLGGVYKGQGIRDSLGVGFVDGFPQWKSPIELIGARYRACLWYTSDAADDLLCVDLAGRRIINKKIYYLHIEK